MLVVAMILACGAGAFAGWLSQGPKRAIETLVVVSNYKTPRLIAELIQAESRQPYLLLPVPESGDHRIYFCPPKAAASEIREEHLSSFVRFMDPRRILVIGDERFVPRRYINMLNRDIPLVIVEGNDWQRNVEELGRMLPLSNLARNFKRLHREMMSDSQIYHPISKPAPKAEPVKAEPAAEAAAPAAPADPVEVTFTPAEPEAAPAEAAPVAAEPEAAPAPAAATPAEAPAPAEAAPAPAAN